MKVEILIGMPGSGKTTYSRDRQIFEESNGKNAVKVFSSDEYRDRLRESNPEMDSKALNTIVFNTLTTDILVEIKNGQEEDLLIFDATNLNRRRRRFFYNLVKRKFNDVEIVAHVFFKSLGQLYEINKVRPERTLPEEVIEKYYFNIQVPRIGVDCDEIEGHGEVFGESEAFKLEVKSITDDTLQHDCSPHHMESVKEHTQMCMDNSDTYMLQFISFFHDLGKAVTKKIGQDGRARYIGHGNVSAYYCLSYCLQNKDVDLGEAGLMAVEIIHQHMNSHQGIGIKNIRNNKLDDLLLMYLAEFSAIDSKSRITAYEGE